MFFSKVDLIPLCNKTRRAKTVELMEKMPQMLAEMKVRTLLHAYLLISNSECMEDSHFFEATACESENVYTFSD